MLETIRDERAETVSRGGNVEPHDANTKDFRFTLDLLTSTGVDNEMEVRKKLDAGLAAAAACESNKMKTGFDERVFEISDGVYLGSEYGGADGRLLRGLNITRVVNCVTETMTGKKKMGNFYEGSAGMEYLRLNLYDSVDEPPARHKAEVLRATPTIDRWVREGRRVLIHCSAGMSRSASVAIGWLMTQRGLSLREANAKVAACRGRALDLRGVYYTSLYSLECPDGSTPPTLDADFFAQTVADDLAFVGVGLEEARTALLASGWDAHALFKAKMGE